MRALRTIFYFTPEESLGWEMRIVTRMTVGVHERPGANVSLMSDKIQLVARSDELKEALNKFTMVSCHIRRSGFPLPLGARGYGSV